MLFDAFCCRWVVVWEENLFVRFDIIHDKNFDDCSTRTVPVVLRKNKQIGILTDSLEIS